MTPARLSLLVYVYTHIRRHGYAPTQHEIAAALNRQQSNVGRDIRILADMGYLQTSRYWRGLKVLRLPGSERAA